MCSECLCKTDGQSFCDKCGLQLCEDPQLKTETWNSTQRNIVNWLLTPDKGGLHERFTTDEINRAIGLLQTNAINLEKVYKKQIVSCKALYPTFSFISHSCVANSRVTFKSDNSIRVIAQRDINKGEEITIQYISHLFSNILRRHDIKLLPRTAGCLSVLVSGVKTLQNLVLM